MVRRSRSSTGRCNFHQVLVRHTLNEHDLNLILHSHASMFPGDRPAACWLELVSDSSVLRSPAATAAAARVRCGALASRVAMRPTCAGRLISPVSRPMWRGIAVRAARRRAAGVHARAAALCAPCPRRGFSAASTPQTVSGSPPRSERRCPLCGAAEAPLFASRSSRLFTLAALAENDRRRVAHHYYRCRRCELTFLDEEMRLPPDDERSRYVMHENNIGNAGYVAFLGRFIEAFTPLLPARHGLQGLDYGCGPRGADLEDTPHASALCALLGDARHFGQQHDMEGWDPFFRPDGAALSKGGYDFVVATEVLEHVYDPAAVVRDVVSCVKGEHDEGGIAAFMTSFCPSEPREFCDWYYARDPTHVAFFRQPTFEWIADHLSVGVTFPARDVAVLLVGAEARQRAAAARA